MKIDNPQIDLALLMELQKMLELFRQHPAPGQYNKILSVSTRLDCALEPILKQKIEIK